MKNPYEIFYFDGSTPEYLDDPSIDETGWYYYQVDIDGLWGPFETEDIALEHRWKEFVAIYEQYQRAP